MKSKRGLTLIELIIVVALVSVAGLMMYSIFGQGLRLYANETKSANEQRNIREALSDITNKARVTDPETITYESGTLNVGDSSYTFDSGKLKKNNIVIAQDIASFEVTITEATENQRVLEIEIANASGKSISTSISLERWVKNL